VTGSADWKIIADILDIGSQIAGIAAQGRHRFDSSSDQRDRAVRRLQDLGNAARRLSAHFLDQHPDLPLRGAIRQRDALAHRYGFEINYDLVWLAIDDSTPRLVEGLQRLIDDD